MKRFALLTIVPALVLLGCQEPQGPTTSSSAVDDPAPLTDQEPSSPLVSDGAHGEGGNGDFFFLPPLVPDPSGHPDFSPGEFNADLDPVVEICAVDEEDCADPQPDGFPIVFTGDGSGSEGVRVDEDDEHFIVNWHTQHFRLDEGAVYRIRVLVDEDELGYADVRVVNGGRGPRNDANDGYFPLKYGRTLPIKFRVENAPTCGADGAALAAACGDDPPNEDPPGDDPPNDDPGSTEIIAFASTRDGYSRIYVMHPDGSGVTALTDDAVGDFQPAVSPDGSKILFRRGEALDAELYVMNADGSAVTNLSNSYRYDGDASWSPDGTKIAFRSQRDRNWEIYVMDGDGQNPTRITLHGARDAEPSWSPDGAFLAIMTNRVDSQYEIYAIASGGGPDVTQLTFDPGTDGNPSWAPAGSMIAFDSDRETVDPEAPETDVYLLDRDNFVAGVTRLTDSPGFDGEPDWSPDGSRIVFTSVREGGMEIWAMNADGTGFTRLTDSEGDNRSPSWGGGAAAGAQ